MIIIVAAFAVIAVMQRSNSISQKDNKQGKETIVEPEKPEVTTKTVKLETSMGDIIIELNEKAAPVTVKNFLTYTQQGFYNGTIFHRVINSFMIQGGDPTGTGTGNAGYFLNAEFSDLPHQSHTVLWEEFSIFSLDTTRALAHQLDIQVGTTLPFHPRIPKHF